MTKFLLITLFSWLVASNSGYEKQECFNAKDHKIYVTIISKGKVIATDSYEVQMMMDSIDSREDMTVDEKTAERLRIISIIKYKPCR